MTKPVTINHEQQLYVIPSGAGYSCLGFDVLERHLGNYWTFIRDNAFSRVQLEDCPHREQADCPKRGTVERYELYVRLQGIAAKVAADYKVRCEFDLTKQLKGLEGHRVEVVYQAGYKPRRFIVGKSTGWYPIHLEVAKRNSTGGVGALQSYHSVRDLGKVR